MFTDRKTQYCQGVSSSQLNLHKFKAIPIKVPASYFTDFNKLILECTRRGTRPRRTNSVLKEKNKVRTDSTQHKTYYYKATVIKAVVVLSKEQTNRSMKQKRAQTQTDI